MAGNRHEEFRLEQEQIAAEQKEILIADASAYNEKIASDRTGVVDPFDVKNYTAVNPLDYEEGDVFAYITIPKIDESLPIYVGASEYHLSIGTATLDGTDLPIGGKDTRAVIAGHRGFPTGRFFKNVDQMVAGDVIIIEVLGETLEYEMVDSEIIAPTEYEKLAVVPGEDTLTLHTCTPYLVGSHRMLINARRVGEPESVGEGAGSVDDGVVGSRGPAFFV